MDILNIAGAIRKAARKEARRQANNKEVFCKCDYLIITKPNNHTIKKGDTLSLTGYLMGQHPTLEHHGKSFVVFSDQEFNDHFIINP